MTARVSGSRSATYRRLDWQLMLTIGRPHLRAADPQASSSAVAPPPEVPRDETASHRGEDQARERVTRMLVGYRRPARLLGLRGFEWLRNAGSRVRVARASRHAPGAYPVATPVSRPFPLGAPRPSPPARRLSPARPRPERAHVTKPVSPLEALEFAALSWRG